MPSLQLIGSLPDLFDEVITAFDRALVRDFLGTITLSGGGSYGVRLAGPDLSLPPDGSEFIAGTLTGLSLVDTATIETKLLVGGLNAPAPNLFDIVDDGSPFLTGVFDLRNFVRILNDGDWTITGRTSDDVVSPTVWIKLNGDDLIQTGSGNDVVSAGKGNDRVLTASGGDVVSGGQGRDVLAAGAGRDSIDGGAGRDKLSGGGGNDVLEGGGGNDRMIGGKGNDEMTGGGGADVFLIAANGGRDMITDFTPGVDLIRLATETYTLTDRPGKVIVEADAVRLALLGVTVADLSGDDFGLI